MAFESLTEKLQIVFKKLTGRGKLSENDVKEAMREVKLALLEADVNFGVVRDFIKKVTERAVGQEILQSLTPGQQVIKVVNEELTALMGAAQSKITFSSKRITTYLLVGLQGTGKTTMAAKLAAELKKQYGKSPLLVACDIYRPAAIQQLQIVGRQVDIPVFEMGQQNPQKIVQSALKHAEKHAHDVMIIDTAGRLHIDDELMQELISLRDVAKPQEILLVVDAMTGQDAVSVSTAFNQKLGIDGVLLTKLDGDARGGAALSVRAVTGKPIKYVGIGEKLHDIEVFYPDRMASRILGMGDILTLIEKAQATFDENKTAVLQEKMKKQQFTLEDYLDQYQQIKKMGGIGDVMNMLPGVKGMQIDKTQVNEKQMAHFEAIIQSMTLGERVDPSVLNAGRKRRIAAGSGTSVQAVNQLLKQFDAAKSMMKMFAGGKGAHNLSKMKLPF